MHGDTIIALSSPPGTSGLAVVRLSGPAARAAASLCLGRPDPLPRHMHYGPFRNPGAGGEILDRLGWIFLPGPGTSTGEDMLEIYPHGNMLLVDRILETLLALSGMAPPVRLAGPGEFTRRALENGKLDLLQAEAVGELIHAQTVDALRNAQRIASGELAGPLKQLRDVLVDLSARMELDMDFAEEEADPDFASWLAKVEAVRSSLEKLSRGFERGRFLARTPRIVLLGAPNAGKSSLVNALIGQDRLLVSAIPGTTRDYVDVPLRLPGGMAHLVDTAGLGRPVDGLDEMAMERTRAQGLQADLVLHIADGTGPQVDETELPAFAGEALIKVRTRKDLPSFLPAEGALSVSNQSQEGLGELLALLDDLLFKARVGGEEDVRLATERQYRAVEAAREKIEAAYRLLKGKPAIEILAFEIREAAKHLRDLLGEISADEVLQRVFSSFCIGK